MQVRMVWAPNAKRRTLVEAAEVTKRLSYSVAQAGFEKEIPEANIKIFEHGVRVERGRQIGSLSWRLDGKTFLADGT